jgi:hypothetical protein
MDLSLLALLSLFFVLPALFTGLYAQTKGYGFFPFLLAGLFFSVLGALLVALLLPDTVEADPDRVPAQRPNP